MLSVSSLDLAGMFYTHTLEVEDFLKISWEHHYIKLIPVAFY